MKQNYEERLFKGTKDHEDSLRQLVTVKIMGIKLKNDVERLEFKEKIARKSQKYDTLKELQDTNESKLCFFKWKVVT